MILPAFTFSRPSRQHLDHPLLSLLQLLLLRSQLLFDCPQPASSRGCRGSAADSRPAPSGLRRLPPQIPLPPATCPQY